MGKSGADREPFGFGTMKNIGFDLNHFLLTLLEIWIPRRL
jgi:hypothetical protein